jgi:hypothetical protein
VESLSTKVERLQWRRNKVLELSSQGRSQPEIATILKVGLGTISRDIHYLREQARDNLKSHINDRLPEEYQSCMSGLKQVLKFSWDIANKSTSNNDNGQTMTMTDDKTRIQALALANDCYKFILDMTTNAGIVSDALKYVTQKTEQVSTLQKLEERKDSMEDREETTNGIY